MRLETERLIFREMTADDYDALYAVLDDPDVTRHYPYRFDKTRVENWITKNIERYRVFGFGLWAVVLKESGEMIGDCGLTMQNINGFIRPEIGYHIDKNHRRRGYAGEAAALCRDWAFENTPFRVLYSYMKKTNIASAATAVSVGMKYDGEYMDDENEITVVYAVAREDRKLDGDKSLSADKLVI